MSYYDAPRRGFLIPDTRLTATNEVTAEATGDEASVRAGGIAEPDSASARLVIESTGDQDSDLVYQIEQGGFPQLGAGARYSYRTATEASTARRGWNAPNLITGWTAADYSTTANTMVCALALANGQILVAYRAGSTTAYFQTYTPSTDTWSGTIAFPATVHATGGIALAQMPEGSVVVMFREATTGQWRIYRYSIADAVSGGAWVVHSVDMFDTEPATAQTWSRLLILPSGDWAIFYGYSGALWQYASNTGGVTFTRVAAGTPTAAKDADAVLAASGKIIVFAGGGGLLSSYTIGSPWTPYSSVTAVTVSAEEGEVWTCADPNGRVYVYVQEETPTNDLRMSYTDDDGATWTSAAMGVLAGSTVADTTTYLVSGQAIHAGGSVWMCHQFVDAAETEDGSVCLMKLGGWSSVTVGTRSISAGNTGYSNNDNYRISPGIDSASVARGRVLIPIAIPSNTTGWTAAGTATPTTSGGRVVVATSANQAYFDHSTAPATGDSALAMARWNLSVGAGSGSLQEAGLKIRLTNTSDYEIGIFLTSTGFVVYDVVGVAALATITTTTSADFDVFVDFRPGAYLWVGYKAVTASTWTEAWEGAATTAVATTGTRYVRWGTASTSTTTHSYRFAWSMTIDAAYTNIAFESSSATYPNIIGRLLTTSPAPLDKVSAYGRKQTYVRGKDGPGRVTDTFQARTRSEFAHENVMWQYAPSPRTPWKSTGTTAQTIVWQPAAGAITSIGGPCIAMLVLNTNAPFHVLSGYTGGAYVTLGTIATYQGFAGLSYTRTGNVIRINGGTKGSRYVRRGEFIGASVKLGAGVVRRIERHSEGVWNTTGRAVELVLATDGEGAYTGTEAASGTMWIYAKNALIIIPDVAIGTYSKIKWEASGGEDVTDGAYRTGQVIIGEVMVMGQTWDWGYTADHTAPVSDTETRPGSTRRSATGPIGRTWGVGWTEGVDSSNANSATTTTIPDFLAYSSGSTSGEATRGDTAGQLKGLLQETRGGEVPVVVLPRIPTSSTIYTDPDLFLYGRIAPELRIENVHGDEGTNTVDRVASVSVREIT
jgi:hypothetical protein